MGMEIDKMIDEIISNMESQMKSSWTNLHKIRYIYIELGKRLSKDTDFFFSVDEKLGKDNLNLKQIKDIYENEFGRDFKVICKSSCSILQRAYKRIGIDSKMVETTTTITAHGEDEEFSLNHWFLVVEDGADNYFMTLTPDLPFIQLNFSTRNFGSDIDYIREGKDGVKYQVYKGEPIKHKKLTKEELKKIDKEIGYITYQYKENEKSYKNDDWHFDYDDEVFNYLKSKLKNNSLYYTLLTYGTRFYKDLICFNGTDGRDIRIYRDDFKSISEEEWNIWIKKLCSNVSSRFKSELGYEITTAPTFASRDWNYESWLLSFCSQVQEEIFNTFDIPKEEFKNYYIDQTNFNYIAWSKNIKNNFEYKEELSEHDNLLLILDKMNALVKCVKTDKGKKNNGNNFSTLLTNLGYHFIAPYLLYENSKDENNNLTNFYIAKKFYKLFKQIFSANMNRTDFNNLGYSEQAYIMKEVLKMMFPEVTRENTPKENYNDKYSAIENRIHIYPLKNNETDEYMMLFNILGLDKSGDYYFLYDPKNNTIEDKNVLEIYTNEKYNILSNRMKNRLSIDDLEDMENIQTKRR